MKSLRQLSNGALSMLLVWSVSGVGLAKPKQTYRSSDDYVAVSTTEVDFEETLINGKMRAPKGFFLSGRAKQSLKQMIKLRSSFRDEFRQSMHGVQALSK